MQNVKEACWTCRLVLDGPQHSCIAALRAALDKSEAQNKIMRDEMERRDWLGLLHLLLFGVGVGVIVWTLSKP